MVRKTNLYCIYCGEDKEQDHSPQCPIVSGGPEKIFGISQRQKDLEFNLHLGRFAIIMTIRDGRLYGTGNPKTNQRILYENFCFYVRRYLIYIEQKRSKWNRVFVKKNIKKKQKMLDEQINLMKELGHSERELKEIMKNEKIKVDLSSGKAQVPLYRNAKTKELVY